MRCLTNCEFVSYIRNAVGDTYGKIDFLQEKKMKKPIFVMLIAFLLMITACSKDSVAEGKENDSEKKDSFTVIFLQNEWHGDPNEMEVLKKLEEKANVDIEWQVYSNATWKDKKNLVISSGEMPDVFYMNAVTRNDINKYAPQGMFLDLTDLIEEYCPRLTAVFEEMPHFKSVCVNPDDGKIYTVARAVERNVQYGAAIIYINKTWLDKLGLAVPKTTDEFYNALKAFKEKDPNGNNIADEIPFSFHYNANVPNDVYFYGALFGAFGLVDSINIATGQPHFIKKENGEIVHTAQEEEWKEAIKFYGNMVQEGLLDAEGFTTPDTSILNAKGFAETPVLGSFVAFDHTFVIQQDRYDDYIVLEPLIGPEGHQEWLYSGGSNGNINGTQFVLTASAKGKEEAIMRWLDAHFDPDLSIELFLGAAGTAIEKDKNEMFDYIETPAGISYSELRYGAAPVHVPSVIRADDWGKTVEVMGEDINKLEILRESYFPYAKQSNIFLLPNNEESDFFQKDGKAIDDYVNRKMVEWMTKGGIEEEWDAFQQDLTNMGIEEYKELIVGIDNRMNS